MLRLDAIHKRFSTTLALDGASLAVRPGTVHALLGENGAGKTTLMRVAYGMTQPDAGTMRLGDRAMRWRSPADAIAHGIGMVQQHFALVPAMTVAENVALGSHGRYDRRAAAERVRRVAEGAGLALDPDAHVSELGVAAQQRTEIVKALARDAKLLILDEPTAVLAPAEAAELLRWLRRFAEGDRAVVLITHKLRDALGIADDVTVLRRGRTVGSWPAAATSEASLAEAMLGSALRGALHDRSAAAVVGADALAALDDARTGSVGARGAPPAEGVAPHDSNATTTPAHGGAFDSALAGASDSALRRASDTALAGASASAPAAPSDAAPAGASSSAREGTSSSALAGSTLSSPAPAAGAVVIRATGVTIRDAAGVARLQDATLDVRAGEILGIAAVEGAGQHELLRALAGRMPPSAGTLELPASVGFVPEDRHAEALVLDFSLTENVALHALAARRGRMPWRELERDTAERLSRFDVRAEGPASPAAALSGGNQQKLVLARELGARPSALVVENPTRGLDLRASDAVLAQLRAARDAGTAVVVYSADLDEVLALADRVLVVHAGRVREVARERDAVGRAMLGAV